MDDIKKIIGKMIREERERQGLTQEQLAEMINSSFGHISNIERGNVDTGITIITSISYALNVSLNELAKGQKLSNRIPMDMNEKMKGLTDNQIDLVYALVNEMVRQNNNQNDKNIF